MRSICILAMTVMLSACGTMGGAVSGAGDDLKTVGGWIKGK
jgi:hypothetical protein